MRHLGLFEGIGGFSYAARMVGWETSAWIEINKFCQTVLKHHFPYAQGFSDIKEFDGKPWRGAIDIVTGGFPCQPYSLAGKRKGTEDDRHLWPEMLRVIREVQPRWVVGENVLGIVNWSGGMVFNEVQADLEAEGYEVQPFVLPACAVNAPHRRDRVWFVAHFNGVRCNGFRTEREGVHGNETCHEVNAGGKSIANSQSEQHKSRILGEAGAKEQRELGGSTEQGAVANSNNGRQKKQEQQAAGDKQFCGNASNNNKGLQGGEEAGNTGGSWPSSFEQLGGYVGWGEHWFEAATRLCVVDDGLSGRLDTSTISKGKWRTESLKAAGNAIVPQVAIEIFKSIQEYEKQSNPSQ